MKGSSTIKHEGRKRVEIIKKMLNYIESLLSYLIIANWLFKVFLVQLRSFKLINCNKSVI